MKQFIGSNGDVRVTVKPSTVYVEVCIKGVKFQLTENESRWLRDFLNDHIPKCC